MKARPHIPLNFLYILVSLLFCLKVSFSNAQQAIKKTGENKYRVAHWTIYDGLSQAETYYMRKDVNGFLWIGTNNGVNRFDGSIFKTYYHDPENKHTIAGNVIVGLIEDSLHNIWIGSDRGLSRYDIKADTFSSFIPSKNDPDNSVVPFWATKDELYALESYSRIVVYNTHTFAKRELINLTAADSVGNGPGAAYAIFDERSNSVWMLRGLYMPRGGGLLNISLSDGKKRYFEWPCFLKTPGHDHTSEGMRYDHKRNAIWINSPDGLMEFTLADKQFHHIDALNELLKLKDYHPFLGIDLDRQGRVWLATNPKGILIYDPSNQSLSIPLPADSVIQHDVSAVNAIIYCDRDGIVWSGTRDSKGFYQLIPYSPAVKLYTPDPKHPFGFVVSVAKAKSGKLWLGTTNGLYEFNKQTGEFKALNNKDFPGLKVNNLIVTDYTNPDLNIAWIKTDAGYFEMDMKTQICRPVIFKDSSGKSLNLGAFTFFLPLKNSWVIIGDYNDKELIFTGRDDDITPGEAVSIPNNSISPFYTTTDYDHLLFIKRDEKAGNLTFSYLDGKLLRVHHKMDTLQWTSIFFNKKDRTYWVAASKQIIHYDNDFKVIRSYGYENGLPDLEIVALIADNDGNIWFHTDRTIHQLNVATGEVSTLTEKDGFVKQNFFLLKNNYKDDNGDIYFPGGALGSGFDRIVPGKYTNPPSSIYLQSLEVNQKPFPLPTGVNNLKQLSLRYNENKITIETGIIDYYSKGASRMRYKLEGKGVNENWQFGPANYTIRFEGLQPGKYKLRMQASNAALQFNGPEKVLIVNISPPWWQTWWAWALYVVLFAASVYAFIAYRSRKLIREKHLLEENVALRTKQLSEANQELSEQREEITTQRDQLSVTLTVLKTTQKQLIQSEKMASLGELTAGIAHEIQNPLNFVNNFSEVSKELMEEMKEEFDKGDIDEVKLIAGDIEQNLDKIIHHGHRADAIVKGMLEHSRKSSGHKELTDINELSDEYLRLAYHGMRAKDKTFSASMNTDFDNKAGKINIIAQDIGRVLLNLFNNAFYAVTEKAKAAGVGYQPTVTINTKRKDEKVIITVSDNGNGIPQIITDKIFQPFFTTKPSGQGTGLGLSLSYDIIKAHEGEINVESKEGGGTKFIVSLPVG
jgi:signal transduction histidine kinase/ligand-binding sensor domain-containing protein